MKTSKNQSLVLILSLIYCSFFIASCKKNTDEFGSGPATVNVSLIGIEADMDNQDGNNGISKVASSNSINEQPSVVEIPLDKNLSVYVSLEEQGFNDQNKSSISTAKDKIAAKEVSNLIIGVKYGVLVYDASGSLVDQQVFTHGNESSAPGFALDGGNTYTFIGYSNNTTTIPTLSANINNLSTATLNNISGDLLYFRHVQTVSTGINNLRIMLRHKFTLITTQLKVGTTYQGSINALANGTFTNLRQNATIKLADSTMTYSSNTVSKNITFPTTTFPVTTISSTPNLLIAPNTDAAVRFQIPSLTVNNIPYVIPATSFNMKAGKKYNLVLTLDVPCYGNSFAITNRTTPNGNSVIGSDTISTNNIYRVDKTQPFIINFNNVDNNFNIIFNNKPLFEARYRTVTTTRSRTRSTTGGDWSAWGAISESSQSAFGNWTAHDANFQNDPNVFNLRFSDNTVWGADNIPHIYSIIGTTNNPAIKITIQNNGTSTITGKKSNNGTQNNINIIANPVISPITNSNISNHIYNGSTPTSVIQTSGTTQTETETRTNMRKTMEFRKTATLPVTPTGTKDIIRIRQSTRHMLPGAPRSITEVSGTYSPTVKINCVTQQAP